MVLRVTSIGLKAEFFNEQRFFFNGRGEKGKVVGTVLVILLQASRVTQSRMCDLSFSDSPII